MLRISSNLSLPKVSTGLFGDKFKWRRLPWFLRDGAGNEGVANNVSSISLCEVHPPSVEMSLFNARIFASRMTQQDDWSPSDDVSAIPTFFFAWRRSNHFAPTTFAFVLIFL